MRGGCGEDPVGSWGPICWDVELRRGDLGPELSFTDSPVLLKGTRGSQAAGGPRRASTCDLGQGTYPLRASVRSSALRGCGGEDDERG